MACQHGYATPTGFIQYSGGDYQVVTQSSLATLGKQCKQMQPSGSKKMVEMQTWHACMSEM
jgi:hypothetical protein